MDCSFGSWFTSGASDLNHIMPKIRPKARTIRRILIPRLTFFFVPADGTSDMLTPPLSAGNSWRMSLYKWTLDSRPCPEDFAKRRGANSQPIHYGTVLIATLSSVEGLYYYVYQTALHATLPWVREDFRLLSQGILLFPFMLSGALLPFDYLSKGSPEICHWRAYSAVLQRSCLYCLIILHLVFRSVNSRLTGNPILVRLQTGIPALKLAH